MEPVRPLSIGKIDVPPDMRYRRAGLELQYELAVDAQGNVTDIIPMAPQPFLDRIAIEEIRTWQFKPATCGGTPVPTDTLFDVAR